VSRVTSINASGHTYGLAPLGVGWVLWRDVGDIPEDLIFHVDQTGGNVPTFALNFNRPGGEVIAQYYNFIRLGRSGYRAVYQPCADTARYLAEEIAMMGPFTLVYDGCGGLPAITYTLTDPAGAGFSLFDLADRVRMRGWQIASHPLPPHREDTVVQRIVIRQGVSRDMAGLLADDLRRAVDYLTRHPAARASEPQSK
jgi:glutamate decarboxylase